MISNLLFIQGDSVAEAINDVAQSGGVLRHCLSDGDVPAHPCRRDYHPDCVCVV
ncbi:MAG: hypothetical protein IJ543_01960 [Bacteroidales bacterium]|nr:hypothetical protein [Bacteroidales bacterium]